ncbi:MAG: deoxynucleoside kinase [Chloroflexota bacterium]|nr:deoxynucleoside kinase [Chloroflexota bacterium]
MKKFITVAGNIGVGKSTLVEMLCVRLGWEPFFEGVVDNPYLADFYADMAAWSFHSQVFFLSRRLRDLRRLMDFPRTVVQDRSVYEDAEIFAKNLYRQGFIRERDWTCYRELYQVLTELLPLPDLIVYLQASVPTLQHRIAQRGREYEKKIAPDYLAQLNMLYEEWIADLKLCPVLVVPSDRLDYVANGDHFDLIAQKVQDKLRGEQLVLFD